MRGALGGRHIGTVGRCKAGQPDLRWGAEWHTLLCCKAAAGPTSSKQRGWMRAGASPLAPPVPRVMMVERKLAKVKSMPAVTATAGRGVGGRVRVA